MKKREGYFALLTVGAEKVVPPSLLFFLIFEQPEFLVLRGRVNSYPVIQISAHEGLWRYSLLDGCISLIQGQSAVIHWSFVVVDGEKKSVSSTACFPLYMLSDITFLQADFVYCILYTVIEIFSVIGG